MIRVAVVMGKMHAGGKKNLVMEYYRHIDTDKVQFDFFCDTDSNSVPKEEIEALGAQILRRQLQIRADGFQDARDRDIGQREKGDGLYHPKAEPAVKVDFQIQKVVSDEAAPPEQHDKGKARNHRGRHGRNN